MICRARLASWHSGKAQDPANAPEDVSGLAVDVLICWDRVQDTNHSFHRQENIAAQQQYKDTIPIWRLTSCCAAGFVFLYTCT